MKPPFSCFSEPASKDACQGSPKEIQTCLVGSLPRTCTHKENHLWVNQKASGETAIHSKEADSQTNEHAAVVAALLEKQASKDLIPSEISKPCLCKSGLANHGGSVGPSWNFTTLF